MKNLWNVFLLFGLFICLARCGHIVRKSQSFYAFNEWSPVLGDTLTIAFAIDSTFEPISYGSACFDEGNPCHTFGNNNTIININYNSITKNTSQSSIAYVGSTKFEKIKDAYPDGKINPPVLLERGCLEGVFVEFYLPDYQSVSYAGQSKNMYMYFDVRIESSDITKNLKGILLDLIKSVSINRKNR